MERLWVVCDPNTNPNDPMPVMATDAQQAADMVVRAESIRWANIPCGWKKATRARLTSTDQDGSVYEAWVYGPFKLD